MFCVLILDMCAINVLISPLSYLMSSYVSPSSGLKGFPVLSHCDATADTANAATHYTAATYDNKITGNIMYTF